MQKSESSRRSPFRALAAAAAGLAVLLVMITLVPEKKDGQPHIAAPGTLSPAPDESKLLAEMERVFPGQVQAVVVNAHGEVDLRLADQAAAGEVPADQALQVTVNSDSPDEIRVYTFSGREIQVPVGGRDGVLSLTPLISGEGGLMVLSERGIVFGSGSLSDGISVRVDRLPGKEARS